MFVEVTFFLLGVLPYWYTISLPVKSTRYWATLCWCCCVWIIYFISHGATSAVVNNVVELLLAAIGLRRALGQRTQR